MQMNREEGFEAGENYRRLRFRRWEIILAAGPSPGFDERNFPERSFNRHPSSFLLIHLLNGNIANSFKKIFFKNSWKRLSKIVQAQWNSNFKELEQKLTFLYITPSSSSPLLILESKGFDNLITIVS